MWHVIIIVIIAKPLWTVASLPCGHGGYKHPSSYEVTCDCGIWCVSLDLSIYSWMSYSRLLLCFMSYCSQCCVDVGSRERSRSEKTDPGRRLQKWSYYVGKRFSGIICTVHVYTYDIMHIHRCFFVNISTVALTLADLSSNKAGVNSHLHSWITLWHVQALPCDLAAYKKTVF